MDNLGAKLTICIRSDKLLSGLLTNDVVTARIHWNNVFKARRHVYSDQAVYTYIYVNDYRDHLWRALHLFLLNRDGRWCRPMVTRASCDKYTPYMDIIRGQSCFTRGQVTVGIIMTVGLFWVPLGEASKHIDMDEMNPDYHVCRYAPGVYNVACHIPMWL